MAHFLGTQELLQNSIESLNEFYTRVNNISFDKVKSIIKTIFDRSLYMAYIGPEINEDKIKKIL